MQDIQAWLARFEASSQEAQNRYLRRSQRKFYEPRQSNFLAFVPTVDGNPAADRLVSDSTDTNAEVTAAKVRELLTFIRFRWGKRCMAAAQAIMDGCNSSAEIGARMNIARQSADCHLERLRSPDVQRKAIELGLVTRAAFIKSLQKLRGKSRRARTVRRRGTRARPAGRARSGKRASRARRHK